MQIGSLYFGEFTFGDTAAIWPAASIPESVAEMLGQTGIAGFVPRGRLLFYLTITL